MEILDLELKDMLTKLLEGQERLETKVNGIDAKVSELDFKVSGLDSKVTELDFKVIGLDDRLGGLETEVKKNSIKLEAIEKKLEIIAEVQTSHKEQNERSSEKILQEQENKNTLITNSLKTVSDDVSEVKKDIKDLKDKFDKVEKVTIQNTYDVAYLKSVK